METLRYICTIIGGLVIASFIVALIITFLIHFFEGILPGIVYYLSVLKEKIFKKR